MGKLINKFFNDISPIFIIGFLVLSSLVVNISADDEVESVTIIGTKDDVKDLPGSGTVITNADLQKAMDTDIHKILSAVPGVYFRTEDGYGLRPNISIRGTSIDRSAKVTLMEDGILIAPAPYTSSSASTCNIRLTYIDMSKYL